MNQLVGRKLRNFREKKGISQEEMADRLHISRSAYGRIENGETNSWSNHIPIICKEFGIEPEDLLKGIDSLNQTNTDSSSAVQNYTNQDTHITINHLSEKVVELYEKRIQELEQNLEEKRNFIKLLQQGKI